MLLLLVKIIKDMESINNIINSYFLMFGINNITNNIVTNNNSLITDVIIKNT